MTQCSADFETGVSGQNIIAADAGSATAWNATSNSAAVTYDTSHVAAGTNAAKIVSVSGGSAQMSWSSAFGTPTSHYGRLYFYMTAWPTGGVLRGLVHTGSDYNLNFSVGMGTDGGMWSWHGSNLFTTMTGAVASLNTLLRLEWHVVHSSTIGSIDVRLYNTASAAVGSFDAQVSVTNVDTAAAPTEMGFGPFSGGGDATIWVDNIVAGASNWVGPISVSGASPTNMPLLGLA